MKSFTLVLTWLLGCCISLSLQSPTPVLPVVCTAPWVIAGENLLKLLPSSEGPKLCSSVLGKYQTVTSTTTLYTSTATSTSVTNVLSVAPAPSSTTTTVVILTSSLTTSTTTTTTTVSLATETDTSISITATTTTTTLALANTTPLQKRSATDTNVQKLCQVLGVATSIISGFCSCEAPGPTSTTTVVTTVNAVLTVPSTLTSFTSTSTPATSISISTTYTTTSPTVTTLVITSVTSTTSTATTTTTLTTTTTTVTASATPTYYFVASYPPTDTGNTNTFANMKPAGTKDFIQFQPSLAAATKFTVDPDTGVVTLINSPAVGQRVYYSDSGTSSYVKVASITVAANLEQLSCSVDASNNLNCFFGTQTAAWWLCTSILSVVQPGFDYTSTCPGAEQISITAVQV